MMMMIMALTTQPAISTSNSDIRITAMNFLSSIDKTLSVLMADPAINKLLVITLPSSAPVERVLFQQHNWNSTWKQTHRWYVWDASFLNWSTVYCEVHCLTISSHTVICEVCREGSHGNCLLIKSISWVTLARAESSGPSPWPATHLMLLYVCCTSPCVLRHV